MNHIKQLRLSKGLSQSKLAKAVGVSLRHIAFMESDMRKPSLTVALRMANILGVSVNEIFELEEKAV